MIIAEGYMGWYVGFMIAALIIVVVVAIVAAVLSLAIRIADQAALAVQGLRTVKSNTEMIPAIGAVNASGVAILKAAQTARRVAGG